jgi:glycosyltransferase involved in cell wall biosynthesis
MRVLIIHNTYQQRGGEDIVFDTELQLLESRGNAVATYLAHNRAVPAMTRARLAVETVWSTRSKLALQDRLREFRPHVAHFHNTFPLISPAGYAACRAEGVPVVQTLHNYRLLCPNALFFRDGRPCEDCLGKTLPWPGVAHACYRGSRAASGVVAAMLTTHRTLGTWNEMVDVHIALTMFAREKYIEGGIPANKIVVKPNFVYPDPSIGGGRGGYALFVGRLSIEKGLKTLLAAWKRLGKSMPLKIVGDGPLSVEVAEIARQTLGVEWLGNRSVGEVHALMGEASALVLTSEWYETFGRVAVEAFAKGTPVIASDIGAISELVEHGRTGLHFRSGDPESLIAQVEWAIAHPMELAWMRREARAEFEAKYTAERNYQMIMDIYEMAMRSPLGTTA